MKPYHFIDEAEITVRGGQGGEGAVCLYHFRSEKCRGDGGNGGRGGNVVFTVNTGLYDLSKLKQKKEFSALPGGRGLPNNKQGKDAPALFVEVPLGTLIKDSRGALLADLNEPAKNFLGAQGGEGGLGNYKRAKEFVSYPKKGEAVTYILDLRLMNDSALIGPPNTGKTTLLNAVSAKAFKASPFPFTTALPLCSTVEVDFRTFTIMELPAMIRTLKQELVNTQWLKHLYRSKVILVVSDVTRDYEDDFKFLAGYLKEALTEEYSKKKVGLVVNKADLKGKRRFVKEKKRTFISAEDGAQREKIKSALEKGLLDSLPGENKVLENKLIESGLTASKFSRSERIKLFINYQVGTYLLALVYLLSQPLALFACVVAFVREKALKKDIDNDYLKYWVELGKQFMFSLGSMWVVNAELGVVGKTGLVLGNTPQLGFVGEFSGGVISAIDRATSFGQYGLGIIQDKHS